LEELGGRKNEISNINKTKNEKSIFYGPGLKTESVLFGIAVTGQCIRDFFSIVWCFCAISKKIMDYHGLFV